MSSEDSGAPSSHLEGLEGIPKTGQVIGGKYAVEAVLGVGGMGAVVAARHTQLGQKVAIKFLRRDAAKSPEAANRFLREARSVVGLQSAHVVRVIDVGALDDGLPYMVMEHLVGTDLAGMLVQRKTLPVSETVDLVLQAMEAIAEAHAAGIIHRDLKPANLFVTRHPDGSPLVKVLDFGISKAGGPMAQEQSLTATATIMGSPLYMSPEQLRSAKNVDARTDVWALGVILYELLTGRVPFEAETVTGLCAKIAADPPVPLRQVAPAMSVELEAVVMRCLDKSVERRFASVAELAMALRPFASPEGAAAIDRIARIGGVSKVSLSASGGVVVAPSSGVAATTGGSTEAAWQTGSAPARKRTGLYLGIAAVGLVGVSLAVALIRPAHHADTTTAIVPVAAPGTASAAPSVNLAPVPAASLPPLAPVVPSSSTAPSASAAAKPPSPGRGGVRPQSAPNGQKPDDLLDNRK